MEKLIELLNEYWEKDIKSDFDVKVYLEMRTNTKKFIERLVKNDKINFDKCWRCYEINSTYDHYNLEDRQDLWLLMLLAISDTPIEDLISYLKE